MSFVIIEAVRNLGVDEKIRVKGKVGRLKVRGIRGLDTVLRQNNKGTAQGQEFRG